MLKRAWMLGYVCELHENDKQKHWKITQSIHILHNYVYIEIDAIAKDISLIWLWGVIFA